MDTLTKEMPRSGEAVHFHAEHHASHTAPVVSLTRVTGKPHFVQEKLRPQENLRADAPADLLDSDAADTTLVARLDLAMKRLLDICGGLVGLMLLAPVWAILALKNSIDRSGPTFYVHKRVGKDGEQFDCYKFRTMVADADKMRERLMAENRHGDSRTFKLDRDPRVTPIGHWLRKYSIDEFPQFLNVLKGDMSLVGPRPPLPSEVKLYSGTDWQRLQVKPGLTCIWQISGRSNLAFEEQLELDLEYIRRRNVWFDLKLVLQTIPAVVTCRGAM